MKWEKELDILGPIAQAERCLAVWLEEEGRHLSPKQRQRAAALIARYFHNEEDLTDQLMLSFLRHYSGHTSIDLEDPTSVRMEIKAVLDRSRLQEAAPESKNRVLLAFLVGILIAASGLGSWEASHRKINREQQAELKALVHEIDVLDKTTTASGIWAETKQPLKLRSYQDMTWWDYMKSRELLEKRLNSLK